MSSFNLPDNYQPDPDALLRRKSRNSTPRPKESVVRKIIDQFEGVPAVDEPMTTNKTIHKFSALSVSNIPKRPETNVGEVSFELKSALINIVQQSSFYSKPSKDANAHLQHFLEICNIFTIREVSTDAVRLRLFSFSLLEKAKQWFYANKETVLT